MAQTIITTDDLDGSPDAASTEFTVDGKSYSIDLTKKNRAAFDKALKPYIDAATSTSSRRTRTSSSSTRNRRKPGAAKIDLAAVRVWAGEQGLVVSERGRIAGEVLEAYKAAH